MVTEGEVERPSRKLFGSQRGRGRLLPSSLVSTTASRFESWAKIARRRDTFVFSSKLRRSSTEKRGFQSCTKESVDLSKSFGARLRRPDAWRALRQSPTTGRSC